MVDGGKRPDWQRNYIPVTSSSFLSIKGE